MIDPHADLEPGQRVSLPHEVLSQVMALLGELPARVSMDTIITIREQAEIVAT